MKPRSTRTAALDKKKKKKKRKRKCLPHISTSPLFFPLGGFKCTDPL
jgi:hypothetical protein